MTEALLFDLDETLMVEEPAAEAAFLATARYAAADPVLDAETLAASARSRARELWYAAPTHGYCKRIGISSWEGLWCRFDGDNPDIRALREWSPAYRRESWRLALLDQGIDDGQLASELAERFGVERRARHEVFAEAEETLSSLSESYALALVTNGAACLQREKLAASGLSRYFDLVVVSGDLGLAKPEPSVFEYAVSSLGLTPRDVVMIGDSLTRDVEGARAAGLRAVWVNRSGDRASSSDLVEVSTLSQLPHVLGELA